MEIVKTGAGAELITLYSSQPHAREPVISILRDTLGDDDPSNDRLRQVWVLSYGPAQK